MYKIKENMNAKELEKFLNKNDEKIRIYNILSHNGLYTIIYIEVF